MQPRQSEESEESMGVKSKAAAAIVILLLFLGCLWLQGGLDYHWDSCLKSYNQLNQVTNSSGSVVAEGVLRQEGCPGQNFQVSALLSNLHGAVAPPSDIMLQPYLYSWDELVKFMEAMGPMVGLISNEIETKTALIRQLSLAAEEGPEAELRPGNAPARASGTEGHAAAGAYRSVRSMIRAELQNGLVDFRQHSDSGCRTLLRLHRALDWLRLFLEKLAETPASGTSGRLRSPSELCREAYQSTLAQHHTWFVRRAAELAFIALPERGFFYRLVCVQNQEELSVVLLRVVAAIVNVYDRTQGILLDNGMLDLP